jgi:hypothetical protein
MHSVQLSNQVTAAYLASKSKFFLLSIGVFVVLTCTVTISSFGQSLGNAGTIKGTIVDPSGAVVRGANVTVTNPITGYTRSTMLKMTGLSRFQTSRATNTTWRLVLRDLRSSRKA